MIIHNYPHRSLVHTDKTYLYFSGTDYLSVQSDEEFFGIVQANLKKWRISYGSSRWANIQLSIYDTFETYMAAWVKQEATLSVSSCTLGSVLVYELLKNTIDSFYYVNGSHPSIQFQSAKPVMQEGLLHPSLKSDTAERVCISSDAILSGSLSPTDFSFLSKIHPNKEITLLIDESHSIGLLGEKGNGILPKITHPRISNRIMIASLNKALGISGGIIAGTDKLVNAVKSLPLFIGSSGTNPALLQSLIDAESVYQRQREKLSANLSYFCQHLHNESILCNTTYPVIYYPEAYHELFINNQIITTHFLYGSVWINRIVITANHTLSNLDTILEILNAKNL